MNSSPESLQSTGKPPAIFLSANRKYAGFVNNLLRSIDRNVPNYPDIFIATADDMRSDDIWNNDKRIHLIDNTINSTQLSRLRYHEWINPSVYYGRLMPFQDHQSFSRYGNMLYLDADTVVCGDIHPLLARPWFFQVASPNPNYSPFHTDPKDLHHDTRRLCLDGKGKWKPELLWNSGVMIIPEALRNDETHGELMRIQQEYGGHFQYADQSLFAFWMAKHGIKPTAESQWNYMGTLLRNLKRNNTTPSYTPVAPEKALIYHTTTGYRQKRGRIEAALVAELGPKIASTIFNIIPRF